MRFLLFLFIVTHSTISNAQNWVRYTDVDSTFSIDLPSRPVELTDTIVSQGDTVLIRTFYTKVVDEALSPNTNYNITLLQYQDQAADSIMHYSRSIERQMIDDIATQIGGSVDYKAADIDTGGSRGRILCTDKSTICRIVTVADSSRILILQVFTPINESLNNDTADFFESLVIYR